MQHSASVDLLRLPVVGPLLRWRHVRLAFQLVLLAVAAIVVLHGLFGPQIAPRNLATVLTSIHWRGLLIVALLAAGNLFCTACPMVLVRDTGRRFMAPRFSWPRRLRRKWVGVGLLVVVLVVYERFDLWELPRATAWLVLGYFGVALAVDLLFKGASFCKHVCPIGQFNFVASAMTPTELQIRDAATCHSCRTYDCIKGRRTAAAPVHVIQRGCELGLFLPAKIGNLDCTFCLDCVHACPHDNIALSTRVPGLELLDLRRRSGIGRLTDRTDIAALAIVFTFAALVSAFAMTAPAFALERQLAGLLHLSSEAAGLSLLFAVVLIVAPGVLLTSAAALTRAAAGSGSRTLGETVRRYAYALVPFGFAVWVAHYGFHLTTGLLTIVPVTQSAAIDLLGWAALGEPLWRLTGVSPGMVHPMQLGFVLLGASGSSGLVHAISLRDHPDRSAAASASWFVLVAVLAVTAVWILGQPMEMRGVSGIR